MKMPLYLKFAHTEQKTATFECLFWETLRCLFFRPPSAVSEKTALLETRQSAAPSAGGCLNEPERVRLHLFQNKKTPWGVFFYLMPLRGEAHCEAMTVQSKQPSPRAGARDCGVGSTAVLAGTARSGRQKRRAHRSRCAFYTCKNCRTFI